jgi:hypothetical protein
MTKMQLLMPQNRGTTGEEEAEDIGEEAGGIVSGKKEGGGVNLRTTTNSPLQVQTIASIRAHACSYPPIE